MAVRGYADWKPKPEAIHWVNRTNDVLTQYKDYWPLSVRQIFYRLVADHEYAKSEAAYNKLTGIISRGRRAGYISWEAVRDGGLGRIEKPKGIYDDGDDFEAHILHWTKTMKLTRQRGQDSVIELWCEAGGMVPILEDIAAPYSCNVNTGGGYDSVTAKHNLAERVLENAEAGRPTVILHVGDFDASGEDMCNVLREDTLYMVVTQLNSAARKATAGLAPAMWPDWIPSGMNEMSNREKADWAIEHFTVERIALTGRQVIDRKVETAPPKALDSRSAEFIRRNEWVADELGTGDITAQLEALTPPELKTLIAEEIEGRLDMEIYEELIAEETGVRNELMAKLDE